MVDLERRKVSYFFNLIERGPIARQETGAKSTAALCISPAQPQIAAPRSVIRWDDTLNANWMREGSGGRGSLVAFGCRSYRPASLPAELLSDDDREVAERQTDHDVDRGDDSACYRGLHPTPSFGLPRGARQPLLTVLPRLNPRIRGSLSLAASP